jgi:hypothetical protein
LGCKGGEIYLREILTFSTKFEPLEKVNPLISKYRINICVPDKPVKGFIFSKSVIEGMANTIKGSGVYAYYFEKEKQLGGHEDDIVITPNGYKITGKPSAYGFADPYKEPYWMEIDGEIWYSADVYIWTGRNPHIEEILENNTVYHSMEVAVIDEEDEFGNKIITESIFLGFCLLQGILPSYTGSKIEKMSLPIDDSEINLLKQEYEQIINQQQEQNNFSEDKNDDNDDEDDKPEEKESIEIDNSKESSVSGKWENPGSKLYEPILEASNKTELIKEAYLIHEEGYEDSPSTKLKYPHHVIKDGKLVVHVSGVQAAFARAKQQGLTGEPINHIERHYKELELNMENFSEEGDEVIKDAVEKFSLNSEQIREILRNALSEFKFKYEYDDYEYNKYYVDCYDAEYVYVWDEEDKKTYRIAYNIVDMVATVNIESKEEVIKGNYIPVGQNQENQENQERQEQMSEEEMAKKNCSENEEEMSSNEFVDNNAMQEINDNSAEENKELSEQQMENQDDKENIIASLKEEMSQMQEKMSKLESDLAIFSNENAKLKEFKNNIEMQNKNFTIESTLKEVENILPKEEIEAFRASSENFSLENIDAWKNEVRAKAFKFSKEIIEKKSYIKIGLPVAEKTKRGTGLWD